MNPSEHYPWVLSLVARLEAEGHLSPGEAERFRQALGYAGRRGGLADGLRERLRGVVPRRLMSQEEIEAEERRRMGERAVVQEPALRSLDGPGLVMNLHGRRARPG